MSEQSETLAPLPPKHGPLTREQSELVERLRRAIDEHKAKEQR